MNFRIIISGMVVRDHLFQAILYFSSSKVNICLSKRKTVLGAYEEKCKSFCLSYLFTHSLNLLVMKLRFKSMSRSAVPRPSWLISEVRAPVSKL